MRLKLHYAWIVLFLAFIALLSAQGIRLSFGAFITPWENDFETNRAVVSLIAFISYLTYGISQPFVGKLVDQYGARKILSISLLIIGVTTVLTYFTNSPTQLMVLYGVVASIGFGGASNVAGSVVVAKWFSDKRGFALGLMSAGAAGGQLLLVPLSLFLIAELGWRNTVLLLGGILTIVIFPIISIFLRSSPEDRGMIAYGDQKTEVETKKGTEIQKKTVSVSAIFRSRSFLFLLFPFFVCGVTTSGLIDTHLIPFAQVCGFSPTVTGAAVSILAGFNIAGTIASGFFADRWSCKNMLAFLYGVRALTIILLIMIMHDTALFGFFITQSHLLILFSISFGIVDFATVAPTIKLATEYFGHLSVGVIIGWLFLSHQIGAALGSYIPGLLYDLTGSYTSSFLYSIILLVAACLMSFYLPRTSKVESKIALSS